MTCCPILAALAISLGAGPAAPKPPADWPVYRADAGRTGFTPQRLPEALSLRWSYRAAHAPAPAWPSSERMTFDRACQPVIAGSTVYFGSSADGKVSALDAGTGEVRWTHFTDAPVRFAPAIWRDRVLVAGDDGFLACLAAADGRLLWRLRGGPKDDMLLGGDRMISRWPARGGPVVVGDVVYFAAGIWPSEGVFLYAVDPATGKVLWCNDSSGSIEMDQPHPGARARSGVAAQGYLAAAGNDLLVPTGRAVPAVFNRAGGSFRSFPLQLYGKLGGADVVAFDGQIYNHGMLFCAQKDVKPQAVGPQIAVHPDSVLTCVRDRLIARDRRKLWVTASTIDRKGKEVTTQTLGPPTWSVTLPHGGDAALIVAADRAIVGGRDRVSLVDLSSRRVAWTGEVDGAALGLAVAGGRLFVSTDKGVICCFGDRGASKPRALEQLAALTPDGPADEFASAADEILRLGRVREGYCLDLGCGDGRLTLELAKRTQLQIHAVDPDAANVEALRRRLDRLGLYGTRVTVHQADLAKVPYARWFADLIVSGRSVLEGDGAVPQAAIQRFQRPCGGVACLGKPGAMKLSTRGPLEGAGAWTHQYSDPANSLCSGDARLKGPLAMLWFRDTDLVLPNRHGRGPAPLVDRGRMFVEGLNGLRAVSIYNGRTLWEVPLPGILTAYHQEHLMGVAGTGSNLCMSGERICVAAGDRCLSLSAADGSRLGELRAPPRPDGKPGTWGFLACDGSTLFGSLANQEHVVKYRYGKSDMSRQFTESVLLFALDAQTDKLKWTYTPKDSLRHNAVAIGGGRIYLIDRAVAAVDDLRFSPATTVPRMVPGQNDKDRTTILRMVPASTTAARRPEHTPGRLLALDAQSGRPVWQAEGAFGTLLALSPSHDVLVMGYQSSRFQLDSEQGGRLAAFRASDGKPLWAVTAKYLSRPILNDRTIYAEPRAWDLTTGRELPFKLTRSYGCGILAASERMLVFRSGTLGYVDLAAAGQTENYGGIRPGCWVNAIPAGGLVLLADAASCCTCSYLNQATIALQPPEE